MAATEKQLIALAAAREAKGIKREQTLKETGEIVKEEKLALRDESPNKLVTGVSFEKKSVWLKGLSTAMLSRDVRSPVDVKNCVSIADEVLRVYSEKFK